MPGSSVEVRAVRPGAPGVKGQHISCVEAMYMYIHVHVHVHQKVHRQASDPWTVVPSFLAL